MKRRYRESETMSSILSAWKIEEELVMSAGGNAIGTWEDLISCELPFKTTWA